MLKSTEMAARHAISKLEHVQPKGSAKLVL